MPKESEFQSNHLLFHSIIILKQPPNISLTLLVIEVEVIVTLIANSLANQITNLNLLHAQTLVQIF